MSTKKELMMRLFDYNIWSFNKVWSCVDQLTDEEFCRETGYSHGSVRNQMVHVISSTRRWFDRMQSRSPRPHLDHAAFPTIDEVKKVWSAFLSDFHKFIHAVSEESLSLTMDWEIASRGLWSSNPQWEILLHVFNHLTDHRAQILAMLDLVFHKETVEQDLVFFRTANK